MAAPDDTTSIAIRSEGRLAIVEDATALFVRLARLAQGGWLKKPEQARQDIEALQRALKGIDEAQERVERLGAGAANQELHKARAKLERQLASIDYVNEVPTLERRLERWKTMSTLIGEGSPSQIIAQGKVKTRREGILLNVLTLLGIALAMSSYSMKWGFFAWLPFVVSMIFRSRMKWELHARQLVIRRGKQVRRIPLWSIDAQKHSIGQLDVQGLWNVQLLGDQQALEHVVRALPDPAIRKLLRRAEQLTPYEERLSVTEATRVDPEDETPLARALSDVASAIAHPVGGRQALVARGYLLASSTEAVFIFASAATAVAATAFEVTPDAANGAFSAVDGLPAHVLSRIATVPGVAPLNTPQHRWARNGDEVWVSFGNTIVRFEPTPELSVLLDAKLASA